MGEFCKPFDGKEKNYQDEAARVLAGENRMVGAISWIYATCSTVMCLYPDHLKVNEPVRLQYPSGICIYCGRHGFTKDHLYPRGWTGEGERRFTAVVPACGTCNSLISDTFTVSITERRELAHLRIRRKFAKVLRAVDHTPEELDEYGPSLRAYIVDSLEKKEEVLRMLNWPDDPSYDFRYLQKSGIDNGYDIRLIEPRD